MFYVLCLYMFGTNFKQKIIFLFKIALISVNIIFIFYILIFNVSLNYILLAYYYASRIILNYINKINQKLLSSVSNF